MDLKRRSDQQDSEFAKSSLKRSVQILGKQHEILGIACTEYSFDLQAEDLHDSGTLCISTDTSAGVEFTNFVQEARKLGYSFAAAVCSPTHSPIGPSFYQDESNIMILSARTVSRQERGTGSRLVLENDMTVSDINTDTVPDELFQIPRDWKVREDNE